MFTETGNQQNETRGDTPQVSGERNKALCGNENTNCCCPICSKAAEKAVVQNNGGFEF